MSRRAETILTDTAIRKLRRLVEETRERGLPV
jgi:hypothetical protein